MPRPRRRHLTSTLLAAAALTIGSSPGVPAQASLSGQRAAAQALRAQVAAESHRIAGTSAGLADAERRLGALDARVATRATQLRKAQDDLVRARIRLTRLQKRSEGFMRTLSANLVDTYKAGSPNLVTVVLDARGFPDLLNRLSFFRRVASRNANILDAVRTVRDAVSRQEAGFERQRGRFSALAKQAISDRSRAGVIRNALLRRQAGQLRRRAGTAGRLR
ncbi:MAG: hypothetical protein ACR2NB_02760, partial [Solirubrobacteraceae bacterium]